MSGKKEEVVEEVFKTVAETAPRIASGMIERRDYIDEENPSEEEQIEADVWANQILKEKITSIKGVGEYVSEEEEKKIMCGEGVSVAIDPLDGSSNIPTNNIVGTIVGIYDEKLPCKGNNLISAFYVVYGPAITIMRAENGQVNEYLIQKDEEGVEIKKVSENIKISGSKVYGFGGNKNWTQNFRNIESEYSKELKLRYGGAFVGDITQTIHYGGIFGYPKRTDAPNGKYRLLYEANPVAYIIEKAGGLSTDGDQSILEVEADNIHQKTPFFAGSEQEIEKLEQELDG